MNDFSKFFEPSEYEGTIVIDRPGIVECSNSTFWANGKNVIEVKSSGVTIRNARIETVGKGGGFAIKTDFPDLILENVEVKGIVKGLAPESEIWKLPSIIPLGVFAPDIKNEFTVIIDVPQDCVIINDIYGLEISPMNLKKGSNSIKLSVSPMRGNTILYGEFFIKSVVKRRICISGRASVDFENFRSPEKISFSYHEPDIQNDNIISLKKGQRINIDEYSGNTLKFVFERKSVRRNMDIDGYSFLLGDNGKAFCDEDLIFFGNPSSEDNSVKISGDSNIPEISVNLSSVDSRYSKIAVCFAIYGKDSTINFSLVDSPVIRIFSGKEEIYRFNLEALSIEKTVVAVELYKYKNQWKMNCIGSGYRDGLRKLCESYGIQVDEE